MVLWHIGIILVYWALYLKIVDYKTVNRNHNFRSHDAACVFIIWVTTPNWTFQIGQKMLLDLNIAVILTSIL